MKFTASFAMLILVSAPLARGQSNIPIVGQKFRFDFGKYVFQMHFRSDSDLAIKNITNSPSGPVENVAIRMTEIRPDVYMVTWQERGGTTVTDIQDFAKGAVYANITEPGNRFEHWQGKIMNITRAGGRNPRETEQSTGKRNEKLVERILDEAFNKKDVEAAAKLMTKTYFQHNPDVPTGRAAFVKAMLGLYKNAPQTRWKLKRIWADGNFVIVQSHYRFSNEGKGYAVVDIFRIKDGKAAEHWDVVQKIPRKSANNNTMF